MERIIDICALIQQQNPEEREHANLRGQRRVSDDVSWHTELILKVRR